MRSNDGRLIFIWRGRDLTDDTTRLAKAIAEVCTLKLFEVNGSLVWLRDGRPVVVSRTILHEIITTIIADVRVTDQGDTWKIEFPSFSFAPGTDVSKGPDDRVLASLTESLKSLVAKGPSAAVRLSAQQLQDIQARLKTGEPQVRIAEAMGIDLARIKELAR